MLQEMAECGAKVVCAQAVEWARRAGIAIYARTTADAPGTRRETVVRKAPVRGARRARRRADRVVLARMPAGELRTFAEAAGALDVPLLDVSAAGEAATCAIPLANVPDWGACRGRLEGLRGVALEPDCAIVSVVGDGLDDRRTRAAALPGRARRGRVKHRAVHAGPLRISATIESPSLAAAQRALHAAFVGS